MRHPKHQEKLEALMRDLERDLSEGKSQVVALEETHKRLRESERICQELADENRRLGEELTGWQERFAKSEENQRQVRMLRQQLETLQAEHVRVLDSNRQMHEKLIASGVTEGVSTPIEDDYTEASTLQSKIPMVAGLPPDLTGSDKATGRLLDSRDSAARIHVAKEVVAGQITRARVFRSWRVGAVFAGVIILVIVCAVTIKTFLITKVPVSRDPIVFLPEPTVEPLPEPISKPPIKTATPIRGAFQTVRSTQVFSGPSEASKLIANIDRGTKVNVVGSRNGWLEIRSKHGRPPGFIRQEATVRIESN
ncbi:MAG TPA: SH3 domain-containing protein [Candidatus Binatia bacterium]|nr:SH3 domain-containing protein [Candidatus Binatia bacterium]